MTECEECKNKLGIIEGYLHPALGKRYLVCSSCFDKVDANMKKWGEFCISNSFNKQSVKNDMQVAWNKNIAYDPYMQKWFDNLWIKIDKILLINSNH